jgi:hypothetical protein
VSERPPDFSSGPAGDAARVLRRHAREVTLFDSAAGGFMEPPTGRSLLAALARRRAAAWRQRREAPALPTAARLRRRPSLAAATLMPALVAAVAGALLAPLFGGSGGGSVGGPSVAMAAELAREAAEPGGLPPLVPVVERAGRPQLAEHPNASGAASTRPAPPAWISIPRAGVDAPMDSLGASSTGLEVPDLGRAGWWSGGPRPGEDGRAVVVGHLDSRDGPDVFARVPDLHDGDVIVVRDARGDYHHYAVVGVTRVEKAAFPTADVYGPAARPVLVLITCGGPYDEALGHYRDNVLVYARAV